MIKKIVFFCIFNDYTNTIGIMRCKRKSALPRVKRSGTLVVSRYCPMRAVSAKAHSPG